MSSQRYTCDIAVIGAGMGGVAAALAAAEAGASVVLTEATDWLGGQMTSQGVSALDEHPHIERFGGSRSYYQVREAIRAYYRERYGGPPTMPDGLPLNPGNGWVSRLCFEPIVGVHVLEALLAPQVAEGRLTILREHTPIAASVEDDRVTDVTLEAMNGQRVIVYPRYVLDATELGDLLPLTGTEYVTGAETHSDTGEPHASSDGPHPDAVQGFTFCFAIEHRPGEDHTISRPEGYERFRDTQPYGLTVRDRNGVPQVFRMFTEGPTGLPPFWTYRRLVDGALLDPGGATRDIAMINWASNDYHWANIIDKSPAEQARIIDEAKRLSLGFLHWLQTEAPRDDRGGQGYPGLRLLPEVMDTRDGLSKAPYIRESRRIMALKRIVENEIAAAGRTGVRAEPFSDSVGVGWYHMDIHECVGQPGGMYEPTLPFQIPLGALIPRRVTNLIAACKNIGTTHLTNGAYRLHPVEWNIGEAAGACAAYCCIEDKLPREVRADARLLRRFQARLLARGVPLVWATDLPAEDPLFVPAQLLLLLGAILPESPRFYSLELQLDQGLNRAELQALVHAAQQCTGGPGRPTFALLSAAQREAKATRIDVEQTLAALGVEAVQLSEPPTWGEVCAALAPLVIRRGIHLTSPATDAENHDCIKEYE